MWEEGYLMKFYNDEDIKEMSLKTACNELGNEVFEGAGLIELLEGAGKIRGHGHTMRQKISQLAEKLLTERWIKDE